MFVLCIIYWTKHVERLHTTCFFCPGGWMCHVVLCLEPPWHGKRESIEIWTCRTPDLTWLVVRWWYYTMTLSLKLQWGYLLCMAVAMSPVMLDFGCLLHCIIIMLMIGSEADVCLCAVHSCSGCPVICLLSVLHVALNTCILIYMAVYLQILAHATGT